MIPRRPFYHILEFQEDFGLIGEKEIHTRSWIDDDDGRLGAKVYHIWIELISPGGSKQEIDITDLVKQYPERLRKIEDEITQFYLNARDKDLDEVGA